MARETVSTRAHDHGTFVARVYKAEEVGMEFFWYDFSGPAVKNGPIWNPRSSSKEQSQTQADQRVLEEYKRQSIDHHCSPQVCGEWTDAASH